MINTQVQFTPKENITIGNGLGSHRFVMGRSYTLKALHEKKLTPGQIHGYFTTNKKSVK